MQSELLLPLRALNETIQDMDDNHAGQYAAFRTSVESITQHVLEGDFKAWRYGTETSQAQMAGLTDGARATWQKTEKTEAASPHGKLSVEEEDGLGLFWITKIGGPSHGFDVGGHCLLPLLSNARTKAIVVTDDKWQDYPAARAYLRLLHRPDGSPILYLEPTQRDFPHDDAFPHADVDDAVNQAVVAHAIAKAEAMQLPLSIRFDFAGYTDAELTKDRENRYVLAPSGGVLEASDTLTLRHDWVQTKSEVVEPHDERLVYDPR